jgi:hypothetical protein
MGLFDGSNAVAAICMVCDCETQMSGGADNSTRATCWTTVTVTFDVTPLAVAVISAVPVGPGVHTVGAVTESHLPPQTAPVEVETSATAVLLLLQVKAPPVNAVPLESSAVAVSLTNLPCSTLTGLGVIVIDATVGGVILTVPPPQPATANIRHTNAIRATAERCIRDEDSE